MGFVAAILGLFLLITFFMPWVNNSRINSYRHQISRLENKVRQLESKIGGTSEPAPPVPEPQKEKAAALTQQVTETRKETKPDERQAKPKPKDNIKTSSPVPKVSGRDWAQLAQNSFEKNIATKLPVWIGAVSLIFAAFFLVKYSIELGWMKPIVRVSLGGLFGLSLLAGGQWIMNRQHIANAVRMSQGLVGAGLVALYVSIYAALNLYSLMPPLIGFGSMAAVTALAVILSLKHGQPIAVFGLLGGLLTPVLVGSDEPNALAMFTYLFLLFSGMFAVLVRRGWWILAVLAVVGVFFWSGFWFLFAFSSDDSIILLLFAMAIVAVVLAITGKLVIHDTIKDGMKMPVHTLNFTAMAGGVITIIWLGTEISLTLFDWSMFGLLSLALMTLSFFKPSIYQNALWVKLGAGLFLLLMWGQDAPLNDVIAAIFGIAAIYVGVSAYIMRKQSDPRFWAMLQAVATVSLYTISYHVLDLKDSLGNDLGMFWGIIALLLASLSIYQASDIRNKYKANKKIEEHLVAIYALAASAFISLGFVIELPWSYVPIAIAGQIMATAFVLKKTEIDSLKKIVMILTFVFIAMNYEQLILFWTIMSHSLVGDPPSARSISPFTLEAPLLQLGLPALLIAIALWRTHEICKDNKSFTNLLFGTITALTAATTYYTFRDIMSGDHITVLAYNAGFIERGVITMTFALAGIFLIELVKRYDVSYMKSWGYALFYLGIIRYVYFDFIIFNPYWASSQFVGSTAIFNGVTLTYGIGTLLAGWAVYNKDMEAKKSIFKILGFLSLFTLVSFTVRQFFHGSYILNGSVSSEELYGYSVAWLLTGLALLTFGIKQENKTARMASLAFMIMTVIKVFLFDAAALEGLYRVFSFLGLGLSLIGLSYFYTKFVFSEQTRKT